MIKDLTNGRLAEIKAYASEHNLTESFNRLSPDMKPSPSVAVR